MPAAHAASTIAPRCFFSVSAEAPSRVLEPSDFSEGYVGLAPSGSGGDAAGTGEILGCGSNGSGAMQGGRYAKIGGADGAGVEGRSNVGGGLGNGWLGHGASGGSGAHEGRVDGCEDVEGSEGGGKAQCGERGGALGDIDVASERPGSFCMGSGGEKTD